MKKGLELKSPFTISQYSTKDGLPQSQVIKILKRKDGSLLLSAGANPVFFDGYSMEPLTAASEMDYILYDRIWYVPKTDQVFGINVPNGQFMQLYPEFKLLNPSQHYLSLNQFSDSLVLFSDNVYQTFDLRTQKWEKPIKLNGFINPEKDFNVNNLLFFEGKYYKTRTDGLYSFDPKSHRVTLEDPRFYRLLKIDPYHPRIVGVTNSELIDVTHDTILHRIEKYGNIVEPLSLEFRNEEEIMVGTTKGLYVFYYNYDEVYWREDGLPSEYCYSMFYDHSKERLYLGTGERGLVSLQFKTNYSFSQKQGIVSCNSLIRTDDGKIPFINGDNSICRLRITVSDVNFPIKSSS